MLAEIKLEDLIDIWQSRFICPGRYSETQSQILISQALPKYQSLLEILRSQLTDLQAYKIQTYNGQPGKVANDRFRGYDLLGLVVGQTTNGDWLGFTQMLPPRDAAGFGKRLPQQNYSPSQAVLSLQNQLEPILNARKSLIICNASARLDCTIEKLCRSAGLLEVWQFRGVFDEEQGAGEPYKYAELEQFIASHLKETRVYVLGNMSAHRLYIIGKCCTGDWLGALTLAIWT